MDIKLSINSRDFTSLYSSLIGLRICLLHNHVDEFFKHLSNLPDQSPDLGFLKISIFISLTSILGILMKISSMSLNFTRKIKSSFISTLTSQANGICETTLELPQGFFHLSNADRYSHSFLAAPFETIITNIKIAMISKMNFEITYNWTRLN